MTTREAIFHIDYAYFILRKLSDELDKSPFDIESLVDKVCGYDQVVDIKEAALECIKQIIEAKKFLGLNCEKECQLIEQMKGGEK